MSIQKHKGKGNKYNTLTDQEKERIFAEDVLGWEHIGKTINYHDELYWKTPNYKVKCKPLTDMNVAIMGVEKLIEEERAIIQLWHDHSKKWHCIFTIPPGHYQSASDTLNEAIVEACIRIKRPDLFKGE